MQKAATGSRGATLKSMIPEIGRQREFNSLVEETLLTLSARRSYLVSELATKLTPEDESAAGANRPRRAIARARTRAGCPKTAVPARRQRRPDRHRAERHLQGADHRLGDRHPADLIASMYGMNFKNIPEYDWAWGYQYGLTLIFLSAIVPLIWFKLKRWW